MTITSTTLFRAAAVAAASAGLIFIGVQINHPYMDATSITTTDVMIRNFLKMLMAALALVGITGIYLRQVTKLGVLGLLGYVLFAAGYLSMLGTEFVAALVLPSIAHSANVYVDSIIAVANNRPATGDIGLMQTAILFTGITYVAGGFVFAIALFRANVLARWAAALLALGTLATVAVGVVPQYERLFALPTGFALVALGYSLWRDQRAPADRTVNQKEIMGKQTRILLVALGGCLVSAPVAAETPTIHYAIRAENLAGGFTGLRIRLDLPVKPGTRRTLDVPTGLMAHLAPPGFDIAGAEWIGGAVPQDDTLSFKAVASHVTITYRLLSDGAQGLSASDQRMGLHANWFSMRGDESLITPDGSGRASASVDLAAFPGWTMTSSLDRVVPLSQVGDSMFLGGTGYRVMTRTVDGASFRLVYSDALSARAGDLLDAAATIMTAERHFWGTPAKPVYIGVVALADDADFSGRGLQGGFSLYLGEAVKRTSWLRLIAHENLHNWISRSIGGFPANDSNLEAWLNEGFTEAYTARLLLSSGLWTKQDYLDDWNTALARYGTSPVKTAPNTRILADRQRDFDVNKLPYDRGRLLAVRWDTAFRARTHGTVGLDDVLRAQMAEAARNDREGHVMSADRLFAWVSTRLTGLDMSADLARYVDRGEPLTLDRDAFGPCVSVVDVTQPMFDRGFDLAATFRAHGRLAGLEVGGPAEKAGLHEGDKLAIDETPTHDSRVTLSYRVDDGDGRSHVISYRPEGAGTVTFQQLIRKPEASADCSPGTTRAFRQ